MFKKPCFDLFTIPWVILVQVSPSPPSRTHFTGQTCITTWSWPIYILSCADCQRNKSTTSKPIGPLHPLPVSDTCCDSIVIDFIRPLPLDNIFDTIITFTDQLGSNIKIVPSFSSLTAEQLAETFFNKWYCENSLPLDIVSNQDKLFMSHFWKTLHSLTGVKLKMSTSYHPETDGSSEQTNKTVIQCIHYAVEHNQKDWVKVFTKIRFDIMNTTNWSTGFTPFQLCFGHSPCLLPPLFPSTTTALHIN